MQKKSNFCEILHFVPRRLLPCKPTLITDKIQQCLTNPFTDDKDPISNQILNDVVQILNNFKKRRLGKVISDL